MLLSTSTLTVPKAILWGGLVAGVLDAMDGVVAYGFKVSTQSRCCSASLADYLGRPLSRAVLAPPRHIIGDFLRGESRTLRAAPILCPGHPFLCRS